MSTTARRVGVLTFHRCINYGSYWQARCLVEGLRERGQDAVLMDHHSARINWQEWRCALQPDPNGPREHRNAYRAKARQFFAAFEDLPLSRPFPLQTPEQGEHYDLVLVGSDEVWNLRHPWYGGVGLFYGDGLPARQIASYAASFGNHSYSGQLDPHWSERLGRFDAISVRDYNSQEIVASATGRRPPLVLDPVLQFSHLVPKMPGPAGQPYALVYGHGFAPWLAETMTDWSRKEGIRLVSVGYDNPWAGEQRIDVGPLEFAALMAGAEAVVTNFFHGCVFALINGKPFVTAPTDYRANKVRDLVAATGAERHLVTAETAAEHYRHLLCEPLEPTIATRIAALRQASEAYLDDVLA